MARPVGDQQGGRAARRLLPGPPSSPWASSRSGPGCRSRPRTGWFGAGGVGRPGAGGRRRVPDRPADVGARRARPARGDAARGGAAVHERPLRGDPGERAPRRARRRRGALRREALGAPGDAGAHPPRRAAAAARDGRGQGPAGARTGEPLPRDRGGGAAPLHRPHDHRAGPPAAGADRDPALRDRLRARGADRRLALGGLGGARRGRRRRGRAVGDAALGPHGPAPAGPGRPDGGDLGVARAAGAGDARARHARRPSRPLPDGSPDRQGCRAAAAILAP